MKTLSKYVLREHLTPLLGGFAIIMFVFVMDFVLDMLNLMITKGVEPFVVLKFFALNLAWMIALAVPMACLIASLMAFGRLAEDGEINATVSSGIPFVRMMIAPIIATLLLSIAMVYFSDQILPNLNYEAKRLLRDIRRVKPTLALKERVFIDDFPGLAMFIEEVDERTNSLEGITIYDQKDRQYPRVVTAKHGTMEFDMDNDALVLDLFDGTIHEIDEADPSRHTKVDFQRQTLRFGDMGMRLERSETTRRGDREMSIADMKEVIAERESSIVKSRQAVLDLSNRAFSRAFRPADPPKETEMDAVRSLRSLARSTSQSIASQFNAIEAHERYARKYRVEVHKKWSLPFACLFFFLVGAPVGVWARKGGLGVAIGFGILFFVVYWAFLIGGEELGDRGIVAPWLAMWMSNFVLLGISGAILYRTVWSSKFGGFGFMFKFAGWLKRVLTRQNS